MKTLYIETGIEEEYENALIASAKKIGWNVVTIMHIPFGDMFIYHNDGYTGNPVRKEDLENENSWYHGSISGGKAAQRATKWKVHAPWQQLRCSVYYEKLGDLILQKDHRFETLESIYAKKDELYNSSLVEEDTLFFRPDGNGKEFTGGCIASDEWEKKYKLITFYDPPMDTRVVVARPQKIQAEARFLIVDGKLITGSYYRTGGQTVRLEAAGDLIETGKSILQGALSRGYNPSPSWVLDLAQTNGVWYIIEVGATSCCGLYKCNTDAFMEALDGII